MQRVFIEDLVIDAVIGVYPHERLQTQRLLLSLDFTYAQLDSAANRDELALALDYDVLAQQLTSFVIAQRTQLLEALVARVADYLSDHFRLSDFILEIRKPAALPAANAVGVRVIRTPPR